MTWKLVAAVGLVSAALAGAGYGAKWWHDQAYAAGMAEGRAAQAEAMAQAMADYAEVERSRREAALARQRDRLQAQAERDLESQRARIEAETAMENRADFPDECNLHPDDVVLFNAAIGANSNQSADAGADGTAGRPGRPLLAPGAAGPAGEPTGTVPERD